MESKGDSSQIIPKKTKTDLSENLESCDKTTGINTNLNVNEMNELSNKKKLTHGTELKKAFGEPQFDIIHDKNNNTNCITKACDEDTTNIKDSVVSVNTRLEIMENSLVDISNNLSSILTLQDTKHQVLLKEFKSFEKVMKLNVRNESNDKIYETQIDEKNKQIDTLRKDVIRLENDIRKSEIEHKKEFSTAKLDFQSQISEMRIEKTNFEIACEKIQSVMTARLHEIDNLRALFERRLEEKDNVIRNLQDRIQSYLYDSNGEPWTKVQRPLVSQ